MLFFLIDNAKVILLFDTTKEITKYFLAFCIFYGKTKIILNIAGNFGYVKNILYLCEWKNYI